MDFLVAQHDISGLPGISRGDVVMRIGSEIIECYEYDVWQVICGPSGPGFRPMLRTYKRGELTSVTVDGKDMDEINAKILAVSNGMVGNA